MLNATEDGGRHLVHLGRGEDELHMLGRFLQRLQQRVERAFAEHVHFVNDVNLESRSGGPIDRVASQLAHIVDARMACRVDFGDVHVLAAGDVGA